MAEIAAFRAFFYNPAKINDLSKVVSPPYDVVSTQLQSKLYRASPYNIVRVDLGKIYPGDDKKNNRYTRAKNFFRSWLEKKILIQDKSSSMYLYAQNYKFKGRNFLRWGLIARLKLQTNNSSVLFHERTSARPKKDRFRLIKETRVNINPIFSLFSDDSGLINDLAKVYQNRSSLIDIKFDHVRHRIWAISDEQTINRIKKIFLPKKIFLADGHHRYEASMLYQKYCQKRNPGGMSGKEPYNYVMMYFTPIQGRALKILPTHRLFKKLPVNLEIQLAKFFELIACGKDTKIFSLMERFDNQEHVFGMYLGKNKFCILRLKTDLALDRLIRIKRPPSWKKLDVSILHTLVVEKIFGLRNSDFKSIFYTQDYKEAIREVDAGNFKIAFFLNPPRPQEVREVAEDLVRMPHKSTYFYPKLLSGLVMNPV